MRHVETVEKKKPCIERKTRKNMKHKKQHEKNNTFETSTKAKIARTRVPAKIKLMLFQPSQNTARLRVARKLNMPSNEEKIRTTHNHEPRKKT
jgi:hypothetical protein